MIITKEEIRALWRVQRVIYKQCVCDSGGRACDFCEEFPALAENGHLLLKLYGKLYDEYGDKLEVGK